MKAFKIFVNALIIALPSILIAQTGPGGVGNTSGTSSLSLWYDANQGVTTAGTALTQWRDMSGYGNHATPPALVNRPERTPAAVNGFPVITFDGAAHFLTAPDAASLDLTRWSVFVVGQINTHKNYNAIVVKGADLQENYEFLSNFPSTGNIHYPVRHTDGVRSTNSDPRQHFFKFSLCRLSVGL